MGAVEEAVLGVLTAEVSAAVLSEGGGYYGAGSGGGPLPRVGTAARAMALDQFHDFSRASAFGRLAEETLGDLLDDDALDADEELVFEALVAWIRGGDEASTNADRNSQDWCGGAAGGGINEGEGKGEGAKGGWGGDIASAPGERGSALLHKIRYGLMRQDYLDKLALTARELLPGPRGELVHALVAQASAAAAHVAAAVQVCLCVCVCVCVWSRLARVYGCTGHTYASFLAVRYACVLSIVCACVATIVCASKVQSIVGILCVPCVCLCCLRSLPIHISSFLHAPVPHLSILPLFLVWSSVPAAADGSSGRGPGGTGRRPGPAGQLRG